MLFSSNLSKLFLLYFNLLMHKYKCCCSPAASLLSEDWCLRNVLNKTEACLCGVYLKCPVLILLYYK